MPSAIYSARSLLPWMAGAMLVAGCNLLTGADELEIDEGADGGGSAEGGDGSGAGNEGASNQGAGNEGGADTGPVCGDAACTPGENCESCAEDCGACAATC